EPSCNSSEDPSMKTVESSSRRKNSGRCAGSDAASASAISRAFSSVCINLRLLFNRNVQINYTLLRSYKQKGCTFFKRSNRTHLSPFASFDLNPIPQPPVLASQLT